MNNQLMGYWAYLSPEMLDKFSDLELSMVRLKIAEPDYGQEVMPAALDYLAIAIAEIQRLQNNQRKQD